MRLTPNFFLQEFVPKSIYKKYGNFCIKFLDDRVIHLTQSIRDHFNKPLFVNTWHLKVSGGNHFRGLRQFNCKVGSALSQHKYCRAVDFHIENLSPIEIQEELIKNTIKFKELGLNRMENVEKTPTWNHCDIAWTFSPNIYIF